MLKGAGHGSPRNSFLNHGNTEEINFRASVEKYKKGYSPYLRGYKGVNLMGIADDMKRLAKEVVSSYESRISEVGIIIDNTHQILEEFKTKRNEMGSQLKETLAREESLRKKDFDNLMKDILSRQDEREKEVRYLLKTFLEEQKEIAETIKKNLAEGENVRISDFKKMLQDIQARHKAGENEVRMMLMEFQKEHNEMVESLRSL
ncbi:MAG: hypothetical protein QMD03_06600, partial [Syntrophales bacterium]|nr:hypothetical protein [Syntrophales bacterium]